MYHLMSRLDLGDRVLYPQGGFTRLIEVVAALAEKHGARLHTGATVTRILTSDTARRTTARHRRRAPRRPDGPRTARRRRRRRGGRPAPPRDGAAARPGSRRTPSRPGATAPPAPARCSRCSASRGGCRSCRTTRCSSPATGGRTSATSSARDARVPDPASIYVCKPSETDPTVAPEGCENLFVLVPVPADVDHRRAAATTAPGPRPSSGTADAAIDQVAAWAGVPDLRDRIRVRHTVGPEDFATRYNAWRGGALGLEHTLRQSAFLRPGNASAQGRRPALRRREHRARRRPADVPDQRRARAEAAQRRPLQPAGAGMSARDEPAPLVLRRHAGVLPRRDAAAGARLPAAGAAQPGACSSPSASPGRRSCSGTSTPRTPGTGGSTRTRRCRGASPGCRSRRSPSSSSSRSCRC